MFNKSLNKRAFPFSLRKRAIVSYTIISLNKLCPTMSSSLELETIIFVLKITVCNKLKDADPALYLITVFLKAPIVRTKGMCLR